MRGRRDLSIAGRLLVLAVAIVSPVVLFAAFNAWRCAAAAGEELAVTAASAAILASAAAIALWAGGRIAAPIAALSQSAAALGRGDEPPLPAPGVREATEIGFALRSAYAQVIRRDEALRAVESRYRAIFETARDAILVIDEMGQIEAMNEAAEALTCYPADELVGGGVAVLLPLPEVKDAVPSRDGAAPFLGAGRELEIVRRDGRVVAVDLAVGRWQAAGRRHYTAIFRDLTRRNRSEQLRRRLEEQLRQAQKMEAIGQLTGGIAHDFNNLLLAINLNLELLADGAACGGDAVRLFDGAQQGVQQARSLIGQLLAFARRQPLTPASFDLSQVIIETAPILRRTLPATIAIETSMGRHLWPVFADQNQLVTALLNLAVNARDAMPQGGRLLIEAANAPLGDPDAAGNPDIEPGDYVSIGVSDTGWGMDPAVVERAFEPFFTTKQSRGTGLGLSQVYGYARQSGGHVAIDSTPGAGTKVTLYLPRSLAEPRAGTPVEPVAEPVRGETILVVEDTLIVRQAVARMLSDLGYRVIAAATGRQALAVLETAEPLDLLFTDVVLPGGISGDELAAMARRRRPGLQVLLTSGYAEMAAAPPVSGGLGAELLPKPYTRAELTASLRRALSGLPQAA